MLLTTQTLRVRFAKTLRVCLCQWIQGPIRAWQATRRGQAWLHAGRGSRATIGSDRLGGRLWGGRVRHVGGRGRGWCYRTAHRRREGGQQGRAAGGGREKAKGAAEQQ